MRSLTPILLLPLAGCMTMPHMAASAPEPRFDVARFFVGETRGTGRLRIVARPVAATVVQGTGTLGDDGTLVVTQHVEQERRTPRTRTWRIREVSPGRLEGTLTGATSPIVGEIDGNRMHIAFSMHGGQRAQQWLTLAPDGRTVHNVMTVTKMGMRVAVLEETITRAD